MFVAELDRPWADSPFLLQGFIVQSDDDVQRIVESCEYVFIDPARSGLGIKATGTAGGDSAQEAAEIMKVELVAQNRRGQFQPTKAREATGESVAPANTGQAKVEHIRIHGVDPVGARGAAGKAQSPRDVHATLGLPHVFIEYERTSAVESELEVARPVIDDLSQSIDESVTRFRETQIFEVDKIREVSKTLVASMIRNPDAAQLLAQLKKKDDNAYLHSVEASVLAALFGRHLGLTERELNTLSLGVLLMDVGKLKIPERLLTRTGKLVPAEIKILRMHVQFSMAILTKDGPIDPEIESIVRDHHERYDGNGYPGRKRGNEIPVYARVAAIIDFYDAITHDRPYRRAIPPNIAINALYERRGTQFQPELVEEFIQALGVYPTGTLVELSSGEVGIVVAQNRARRLRPQVLIVRDAHKQVIEAPFPRDLEIELSDASGRKLMINTALKPGTYGVSADDFYL